MGRRMQREAAFREKGGRCGGGEMLQRAGSAINNNAFDHVTFHLLICVRDSMRAKASARRARA